MNFANVGKDFEKEVYRDSIELLLLHSTYIFVLNITDIGYNYRAIGHFPHLGRKNLLIFTTFLSASINNYKNNLAEFVPTTKIYTSMII